MPILSRKKNMSGSRARKFGNKAAKKTARQILLERVANIPDDEVERKRKKAT